MKLMFSFRLNGAYVCTHHGLTVYIETRAGGLLPALHDINGQQDDSIAHESC